MPSSGKSRVKSMHGIIAVAASIIICLLFSINAASPQEKALKKLYISSIKAEGIDEKLAKKARERMEFSLYENFGKEYRTLTDEDVKVMFKKAAEIMATGCNAESCQNEIADAVDADEVIYGELSRDGAALKLSARTLLRDRKTLSITKKAMLVLSFAEKEMDHYCSEAAKKLVNPAYAVQRPPKAAFDEKISLKAIETEKVGEIKGIKGVEGLGIAVMKFTTTDESITKILAVLKNYIGEGDSSFKAGDYSEAVAKYSKVSERIEKAIRPESRNKMSSFEAEVKKRIEAAYSMNYKVRIDAADTLLSSGEYEKARSKLNDILGDMAKNIPAAYMPAMAELNKGIRNRLDASWTAQFKKEIEDVDSRLKGKESAEEKFLRDILLRYNRIEAGLPGVPSEALGDGVAGIEKSLRERKDAVIITMAALKHRKGDALYNEYRFDEARREYEAANSLSGSIRDKDKRAGMEKSSREKLDTCATTGRSYLTNRVKAFMDRAEVLNVGGDASGARKVMEEAKGLLSGPMVIFATEECIRLYNSMAGVLGIDALSEYKDKGIFDAIREQKRAEQILLGQKIIFEAMKNFKAKGGGKTKTIGGVEFVYIPGGEFMMGSPEGEGSNGEHPQHQVKLDGFWMGKYEMTQAQYESVMGNNPSNFKGSNLPVESVSWNDAVSFCERFGAKYGAQVRLPTEAEWEYACRAGTTTRYYWGDNAGEACRYGNVADKSAKSKYSDWTVVGCNDGYVQTAPVGSFAPNAWGLYDMSGNVWEWCADRYGEKYYGSSPNNNPKGPGAGESRVLRGGSWLDLDLSIRSAYRDWGGPGNRSSSDGFRLVLVAK